MPPARGPHDAFSPAYGCLCDMAGCACCASGGDGAALDVASSAGFRHDCGHNTATISVCPCTCALTPLPPLPFRNSPVCMCVCMCVCVSVHQLLWRLGAPAMASTAHAPAVAPALVHPSTCALVTTASTVGHVNSVRFVGGCRTDLVEERGWADAGVVVVWWVASVDCPSHTAWADLATADDTAHAYAPCSNRVRCVGACVATTAAFIDV